MLQSFLPRTSATPRAARPRHSGYNPPLFSGLILLGAVLLCAAPARAEKERVEPQPDAIAGEVRVIEDQGGDYWGPAARAQAVEGAPGAELERGHRLLRLKAWAEAAHAFQRLIALDPDDVEAHEGLRRAMIGGARRDLLDDELVRLVEIYAAIDSSKARSLAEKRFEELLLIAPAHAERSRLERLLGRVSNVQEGSTSIWERMRSLIGIVVLLAFAWLISNNRRKIRMRLVAWGLGLQLLFALLILKSEPGRWLFDGARAVVDRILRFTDDGAGFLFGSLYRGIPTSSLNGPVQYVDGTSGDFVSLGAIFAFHVLPTIIFFGSLMGVLYHLRIVQRAVRGIAWLMTKTMGTSGSESLAVASNIFVGQTEAPLVVKPYVSGMTRSELTAIMVGGFATVSGGVLAAYARFGIDAGHLLAATVMSAPAALVVAKIIFPESEVSETAGGSVTEPKPETANVIDAAAAGATDGLKLALNVAAMLLAFIALIAMLNWGLGAFGSLFGYEQLSLKHIFGVLFYPLSWSMGVDNEDLLSFGFLLGTKISINEFVAFVDLGHLKSQLSPRSFTIATYALCGFANFSSIGIQIGGISSVAPARRSDLAQLGLKAMVGGAIASWLTACVAGLWL